MKTVIDAVNKYKATWQNGKIYVYVGSSINTISGGSFQITYDVVDNKKWDFVCTADEFNKCVEEMTNMNIKPVYTKESAAIKSLEHLGYTYHDAEFWKPPLSEIGLSKPIYSQAMVDAGVMPSVGMNFRDGVILVDADSHGMYVVSISGVSIIMSLPEIKPLDTRTDTEKAIDDLECLFYKASPTEGIIKAIKAGNIHGVTWSGK